MTTTTTSLAAFLLDRIADDEAAALAASPGPWETLSGADMGGGEYITTHRGPGGYAFGVAPGWNGDAGFEIAATDAAHIARHDPTRVLAGCAAKRAIVLTAEATDSPELHVDAFSAMRDTLRRLAAVYADHPTYDPAWAVS